MRRKKWVVSACSKDLAASIAERFSVNPLAALLVVARGLQDNNEIEDFFDTAATLRINPLSLKDMDKAAARINKAVDLFEKIAIFGDYDADGITATAILYSYLEMHGANVIRYIPDRIIEGYGLSIEAVESLAASGVNLIVTVDNGISAIDEALRAKELGVDLIVTDHHKAGDKLPEAVAVVDPQRADCECEYRSFAGVGVALELVCALEGAGCEDELLDEFGDLAALGTIADVVPVTGENRAIIRRGLEILNSEPRVGISALMEKAGAADRPFVTSLAAFTVCPRINAAGRMGSAHKALDLLLCDDEDRAQELAQDIHNMNLLRQKTENEIYEKACEQLSASPEKMLDKIIVVDSEGWHQGVIGIVASKLVEQFGRPAIVISRNGETAKGSCRSIEGFSIYDAIEAVSDCLTHFGGHTLAAGIGLESEKIDEFRHRINEYAKNMEMPFAVQRIDCRIHPRSISLEILDALDLLEPFGTGNPQPCFGLYGVKIDDISSISEGKHIRMSISKNGTRTGVVYFGMSAARFPYQKGDTVDLAVNLDRNVYNGDVRVSVIVRNIRPCATNEDVVLSQLRLFERILHKGKITPDQARLALPDRELQVSVFKFIKAHTLRGGDCEVLSMRLGDDGSKLCKIMTAVEMMLEMGILCKDEDGTVFAPENPPRVNLEESALFQRIKASFSADR